MGWGSSARRGGGRKVCALPLQFVFLGFEGRNLGCPRNFAGNLAGHSWCSKSLCKKTLCSFFGFHGVRLITNLMIGSLSPTLRFRV